LESIEAKSGGRNRCTGIRIEPSSRVSSANIRWVVLESPTAESPPVVDVVADVSAEPPPLVDVVADVSAEPPPLVGVVAAAESPLVVDGATADSPSRAMDDGADTVTVVATETCA
jgi:hypothetical protein